MVCDLNLVDTDTVAWNTPVQGANGLEYSAYLPGHIGATLEPIQGVDNAPRIEAAIDEQLAKNPLQFGSWSTYDGTRTIRGGACLSLCPGEWTLQSPVKLPPGTTLDLWGAHMVAAHSGNMFEVTNNQAYNGTNIFTIDSVQIHGHCNAQLHGEGVGSTAIYGDTMGRCSFRDMVIQGFTGPAIRTEQSLYCKFESLYIAGNGLGAKLGERTDVVGLGHHANNWDNCQFIDNANGHVEIIGSADSSKWDSCTFEHCPTTAVYMETISGDRIRGNVFDSCHWEQNRVHLNIQGGLGNTVTGGVMEMNLNNSSIQTERMIINRGTSTTVMNTSCSNNAAGFPSTVTSTGAGPLQAMFEQSSVRGDMLVINNFRPYGAAGVLIPYATDENANLWPESLEPYGTTTTNARFRIVRVNGGGGPNELNI